MFLTKEPSYDITNSDKGGEKQNVFSGATFSKAERLRSKKIIASLFEAGQSFLIKPLRLVHLKTDTAQQFPVQVAMSVPKKLFPLAADRNRIKRLMREAYRRNKNPLLQHLHNKNIQIAVIIIYTSPAVTTFNEVENKMKLALNRLIAAYDLGG